MPPVCAAISSKDFSSSAASLDLVVLRAPGLLDQHRTDRAISEARCAEHFSPLARKRTAFDDHRGSRHARGRREGVARTEHVQMGESAFVYDAQGVLEHLFGFGGEPGDDIGTEDDVRAHAADFLAEGNRIGAQMTALHPLQNHVITGLQREMEMRHQSFVLGDDAHQVIIGLDAVD